MFSTDEGKASAGVSLRLRILSRKAELVMVVQ